MLVQKLLDIQLAELNLQWAKDKSFLDVPPANTLAEETAYRIATKHFQSQKHSTQQSVKNDPNNLQTLRNISETNKKQTNIFQRDCLN